MIDARVRVRVSRETMENEAQTRKEWGNKFGGIIYRERKKGVV